MINSLVGQSEILTLSGTALLLNNQSVLGGVLLSFGIVGGLCRYMLNFQLNAQEKEKEENEAHEKLLSKLLSAAEQSPS